MDVAPIGWLKTKRSCTTSPSSSSRTRASATGRYAKALAKFGEAGVVEAASLEGYYTFLAMVMNVARSPSPANATQRLAPYVR